MHSRLGRLDQRVLQFGAFPSHITRSYLPVGDVDDSEHLSAGSLGFSEALD